MVLSVFTALHFPVQAMRRLFPLTLGSLVPPPASRSFSGAVVGCGSIELLNLSALMFQSCLLAVKLTATPLVENPTLDNVGSDDKDTDE